MKAYISKYALTADVYEKDGYVSPAGYFFTVPGTGLGMKLGQDAHLTREAALIDAEARRDARIKQLEKQIQKLKALKFK